MASSNVAVTSDKSPPRDDDADDETFVRKPSPFTNMLIDDNQFLSQVPERQQCPTCNASRKYFCYTCYKPLPGIGAFPAVRLPVQIDIIKHRKEIDGKSTSAHARLLASDHCRIYQYPDIPDYSQEPGVILIYPSHRSRTVPSLFSGVQLLDTGDNYGRPVGFNIGTLLRFRLNELSLQDVDNAERPTAEDVVDYDLSNLPVKRAVFIDSTWNQSRSIYKDPRVGSLPCVVLQNRLSQFWRHQKGSPRWYLSTVEAIHQFLLEVHVQAWGLDRNYRGLEHLEIGGPFADGSLLRDGSGCVEDEVNEEARMLIRPYNGQYDNLLFLFTHMYSLIHTYYDHNKLKAYKRPIT